MIHIMWIYQSIDTPTSICGVIENFGESKQINQVIHLSNYNVFHVFPDISQNPSTRK